MYYKLELQGTTAEEKVLLLERLSDELGLPIETSTSWRVRRQEPFLQIVNSELYIRHIKHLSGMESNCLVDTANDIVNNFIFVETAHSRLNTQADVATISFKFFH
jgi:hypothetical protein